MRAHVTCGRGTEPFARDELLEKLHKLQCNVSSVEDGKVFFSLADLPEAAGVSDKDHGQMFNLKAVERLFATVTHFPTADIKGNGKVGFLRALKDRILKGSSLKEAVKNIQKLQLLQKPCDRPLTDNCHRKWCENGTPGHVSPLLNECSSVPECDKTVVESSCSIPQNESSDKNCWHQSQENSLEKNSSTVVDKNHYGEQRNNPSSQVTAKKFQPNHRVLSTSNMTCSHCGNGHKLQTPGLISHANRKRKTQTPDLVPGIDDECCTKPPEKLSRCDFTQTSISGSGGLTESCTVETGVADTSKQRSSLPDLKTEESSVSFRFSVKCAGWCKKWLQPQRLAKELAIRLTVMTGWAVDLTSPDIEICVHINDDFVTAGIPLTRLPLSKRDYIQDAGLRSTISWIMAWQAQIRPGHRVLDPMCGKATILVEAAREYPHMTGVLGCDIDPHQLRAADRNVVHAGLCQSVQLIQANVLNLPFRNGAIDRIVCDAPFGNKFTVASCTLPLFYKHMMQEMHRLLAAEGLAVLLTSQELLPVVQGNCRTPLCQEPSNHPEQRAVPWESSACDSPDSSQKSVQEEASALTTLASNASHAKEKAEVKMSVPCDVEQADTTKQLSVRSSSCHQPDHNENSADFRDPSPFYEHKLIMVDGQPSKTDDSTGQSEFSSQAAAKQQTLHEKQTRTGHEPENDQFSLLSQHYVKLGETHAYIVVLQKSA